MAPIVLERIEKTYPNGFQAARGIDIAIADGELMVLVGPSGCGKSTTLRIVAGLETPTSGRVLIGGRDVTALGPQDRDVAMVFQSYALYPHKTVRKNLAFALELRRVDRATIARRIAEAAGALGLEALLDRKPGQLSGGQRQRVALGRAIVREPQAFLFDEPLSNLDAKLRAQTRAELGRLHRRLGATMLYVTHDQEEAMTLGDRIAVLRDGKLLQCAAPMEVYGRPASGFVAGFVGSPSMNFVPCRVRPEGAATLVESDLFTVRLDGAVAAPAAALLGVRPRDVEVVDAGSADAVARVDVIEPLGSEMLVHLETAVRPPDADLRVLVPPESPISEGETIGLRFRRERIHLFDAATDLRLN
ncbi:MAG: sn-glycerol-3-phosphate ABC transporter ATP-binding protein UgpC [Deltaproteobacteria bacterium]|nr:sn-glycerol-3-phosphate ABC transporter ATP-binding protein UgpC [Deltaproteobacteria bacterium]